MLNVGDTAPEISSHDQDGAPWSLTDALRNGELVLYFYPADFTPVCTREACEFRDNFDGLQSVKVQIIGVQTEAGRAKFPRHSSCRFHAVRRQETGHSRVRRRRSA
jgi:peroxiredoxin Q/BCP